MSTFNDLMKLGYGELEKFHQTLDDNPRLNRHLIKAEKYFFDAYLVAQRTLAGDYMTEVMCQAQKKLGATLALQGRLKEAKDSLILAERLAIKLPHNEGLLADVWRDRAIVESHLNSTAKTLEFLDRAAGAFRSLGNEFEYATTLTYSAIIYLAIGNRGAAAALFERADRRLAGTKTFEEYRNLHHMYKAMPWRIDLIWRLLRLRRYLLA